MIQFYGDPFKMQPETIFDPSGSLLNLPVQDLSATKYFIEQSNFGSSFDFP